MVGLRRFRAGNIQKRHAEHHRQRDGDVVALRIVTAHRREQCRDVQRVTGDAALQAKTFVWRQRHDAGADLAHAVGAHQRFAALHAERPGQRPRREQLGQTEPDAEPAEGARETIRSVE